MSMLNDASITIDEPFHGTAWLRISQHPSKASVHLVVSLKNGWDADIWLPATGTRVFADASGPSPQIAQGETPDGHAAVVLMEDDRLAVSILRERLSDILILGEHAREVRAALGGGP
jgi:hypothetical protein